MWRDRDGGVGGERPRDHAAGRRPEAGRGPPRGAGAGAGGAAAHRARQGSDG